MTHFASGRYHDAQRIFASVSGGERVGVGGSNGERELIDLVEKEAGARIAFAAAHPTTTWGQIHR